MTTPRGHVEGRNLGAPPKPRAKKPHPEARPADESKEPDTVGGEPTALNRSLGHVNVAVARMPKQSKVATELTTQIEVGRKRWPQFLATLRAEGPDRNDGAAAYAARYISVPALNQELPANLRNYLATMNIDTRGFTKCATGPRGGEKAYENYYNAKQGVIVASWNYADKDVGDGTRLNLSEILFHEYTAEAERVGSPVKNLRYVVRSSIQGQAALKVMETITPLKDRFGSRSWEPGSDEFNALLSIDNVKSIPYLLTDHREALGHKSILRIVTFGLSALVIELG